MAQIVNISALSEISAFWPDSEHIRGHVEEVGNSFENDKHGCMDNAKCLLESVCKTVIYEKEGRETTEHILNRLFAEALKVLGVFRTREPNIEYEFFNYITLAIKNLGDYRNSFSKSSHGHLASVNRLTEDTCSMVIGSLIAASFIVFNEHKQQTEAGPNFKYTLRSYEAFERYNDIVDDNLSASIDADTREVVFNESMRYRYSQILFALDRSAYDDVIKGADLNAPEMLSVEVQEETEEEE